MEFRKSIQEVHKVYETSGSQPALVTCDDLKDWVCKYHHSKSVLFNEFLSSCFLNCWKIPTPEICFLNLDQKHIPEKYLNTLQPHFFKTACFGSKFLPYAKEMDYFFGTLKHQKQVLNKIEKEDFLKIGLFDLWISNDDRNHNNYNLLLNADSAEKWRFYAIDHGAVFNTGCLNRGLVHITEEESILNSNAFKTLFSKRSSEIKDLKKLLKDFYFYTLQCEKNVDNYIEAVPESWNIDKHEIKEDIKQIFSSQWLKETEQVFLQYVQKGIR